MAKGTPVDRRTLLRRGLQFGALAAGALATSLVIEHETGAPRTTSTSTSSPTNSTTTSGPLNASAWSSLAASLAGRLVRPSSAAYAADRLLYNSKFTDLNPKGIAYCATPDDVARCIEFARGHALELRARCGGHSYGGYSSVDGLVIDVSPMAHIAVDTRANIATVGAGARLIDVYDVIGGHDRVLPGGSCPTVGIAGLTLGGGVGVFSRKFGLTSDNLRSLDLVLSDGSMVTADHDHHRELLWASRGGGGGNFAVATSFEFDVHPTPPITMFSLQFPWAAAASMLAGWTTWVETAPDELWSNCELLSEGTAGLHAQVGGVYCGSAAGLAALVKGLRIHIDATPTSQFIGGDRYLDAMKAEAGCAGLTIASCHLASQNPHGTRSREAYSAKSSYVSRPMDATRATQWVHAIEHFAGEAPYLGGALAFDAYGGALNRLAPDATAFVHRDKLAGVQATSSWSTYASVSQIATGASWLSWLAANVFDDAEGAYQNYIDPTLADWRRAYYGENLKRLVAVKNDYDPDDVFSFPQSIPLSLS